MREFEILKTQLERAKSLSYNDYDTLDDIVRKGKMTLENLMPTKLYSIEIGQIKFSNHYIVSMPESTYRKDWEKGQNKLINLLDTAIQDFEIQSKIPKTEPREIIKERIIEIKDESEINTLKGEFRVYKQAVKNWSLFITFSQITSILIWLYFTYSDWEWYNAHDKKIGITLLFNLTIIVALLNIPLKTKWLIWIPIIFASLTTLFTLI
jgi:hypothetical protein